MQLRPPTHLHAYARIRTHPYAHTRLCMQSSLITYEHKRLGKQTIERAHLCTYHAYFSGTTSLGVHDESQLKPCSCNILAHLVVTRTRNHVSPDSRTFSCTQNVVCYKNTNTRCLLLTCRSSSHSSCHPSSRLRCCTSKAKPVKTLACQGW